MMMSKKISNTQAARMGVQMSMNATKSSTTRVNTQNVIKKIQEGALTKGGINPYATSASQVSDKT